MSNDTFDSAAGLIGTAVGAGVTLMAARFLFDEMDEFSHPRKGRKKRRRDDFF